MGFYLVFYRTPCTPLRCLVTLWWAWCTESELDACHVTW